MKISEAAGIKWADPADDPEPRGHDTLDGEAWTSKIESMYASGNIELIPHEGMSYASKAVRAAGLMEPEDSEFRHRGYRYFQVTRHNWQEVIEKCGYPVPDVPNSLSLGIRQSRRTSGPEFIIHTFDETEPEEQVKVARERRQAVKKDAVFAKVTDEAKLAEIAKRRSELPPR